MNDVFALIVGIEKYDQPGWDITGPCRNAIAIADQLIARDMPRAHIQMFLSPAQDLAADLVRLKQEGVSVEDQAGYSVINKFWRTSLHQNPPNSKLLVFWSGHGFTDAKGSRIFICSDYTAEDLQENVFNASGFVRSLRTARYNSFPQQLILADACGTYADQRVGFRYPDEQLTKPVARNLAAIFATGEGVYAKSSNGRGEFTEAVLQVLRATHEWQDPQAFSAALENALTQLGRRPFLVNFDDDRGNRPLYMRESHASELFESVHEALSNLAVPDAVFRKYYLRTSTIRELPEALRAAHLPEMLQELCGMQDAALTGQLPYGLVEFLLRLKAEPVLHAVVENWFASHPAAQQVISISARVQEDQERLVLLIDAELGNDGTISRIDSYLRGSDGRVIPHASGGAASTANLDAFYDEARRRIAIAKQEGTIDQIHFLIDLPLFGVPFHAMPFEGKPLGRNFGVVLRHRPRFGAQSQQPLMWNRFEQWAVGLLSRNPAEIAVQPITRGACDEELPDDPRFCYLSFIVEPPAGSPAALIADFENLRDYLDAGAPSLFWLHKPPDNDDWSAIKQYLEMFIGNLKSLDSFPESLADRRVRREKIALNASLLWDHPDFPQI